ncbi:hypothetical protein PGB90_005439 [Kerria lacca]
MKLTSSQVSSARFHKRSGKGNGYKKLLFGHPKSFNGSKREIVRETSPCDNSDDSGLGVENSADYLYNSSLQHPSVFRFSSTQKRPLEEPYALNTKRHRIDLKTQNDLQDPCSFPVPPAALSNSNSICINPSNIQSPLAMASKAIRRSMVPGKRLLGPVTLSSQLSSTSRNGRIQLQILNQPEQQHRARYQTEGSRGAVKDRTGNSFPMVKIVGYNRLTTLQVFIGSDQGRVTPHMFYQACRVTGKNSTPCSEKNINGTIVIEIDIDPTKDMTVMCDCVGILKERNVDVEHRFPEECSTRSKKKSTRCRMVFRTAITNDDGTTETLQIASQPIACTQPPGVPEICKKSCNCCAVSGGKELFILGKNFLKDTRVLFQTDDWEQSVNPDKEFLQQTHLVCIVPAFKTVDIKESVNAKISVVSGNRASEPHTFTYTPLGEILPPVSASNSIFNDGASHSTNTEVTKISETGAGSNGSKENQINTSSSSIDDCENIRPVLLWPASTHGSSTLLAHTDSKMMPPPLILPRRSSMQMIIPDSLNQKCNDDTNNAASDTIKPVSLLNANSTCNNNNNSDAGNTNSSSNQMTNTFIPTQFTSLSDVPMLQEFARNFHSITNVDTSLKSEPVPKVEPMTDSTLSCAEPYTVTQNSDTKSTSTPTCIVPSIKNQSMFAKQSPDLYSNSENYIFQSTTDMYSSAVSKTEPRNSPVEELSAFEVTVSSPSVISSKSISNLMLSSSRTLKSPTETSNFIVSNSISMNPSPTAMSNIRPTTNLTETSFSKHDKNFEFDKLLSQQQSHLQQQQLPPPPPPPPSPVQQQQQQQQQQQLTSCQLKPSSNYENIHRTFCYKNVPPATVASVNVYHRNYMNLENESSLNSDKEVMSLNNNVVYKQSTDIKSGKTMNMTSESSLLMENSSMVMVPDIMRSTTESTSDNYPSVLPLSKSYSPTKTYSQDTILNKYVPTNLVTNSVNVVPKLEALVNSAAESHMRTVTESSSSLNLLNDSVVSDTDCTANSMTLDNFLSETPRNNILNAVICNTVTSTSDSCVVENPLLIQTREPVAYSQCANIVSSIDLTGATPKQMDMMVMKTINEKDEKAMSVPNMSKKTEEGMFSSEISRMSEHDLLRYINPSCFDEENSFDESNLLQRTDLDFSSLATSEAAIF